MRPNLLWDRDGVGQGDRCDSDIDGDGVANDIPDQCEFSAADEVIDPNTGCSITQLVPCDSPIGTDSGWQNHDKYVSYMVKSSKKFVEMGLITQDQRSEIISNASGSDCGQ